MRRFLMHQPFTDPDIVLSVEHLIRESGIVCPIDEYDHSLGDLSEYDYRQVVRRDRLWRDLDDSIVWPVDLTGKVNWLDKAVSSCFKFMVAKERSLDMHRFLDEFSVTLGHRTTTEEKWISDFESMVYHFNCIAAFIKDYQSGFVSSILNQHPEGMVVERCIVKPFSEMILLEVRVPNYVETSRMHRPRRFSHL